MNKAPAAEATRASLSAPGGGNARGSNYRLRIAHHFGLAARPV